MDVAVLSALCFLRDRASLEAGGHAILLALVANAFGRLPLAARQDLFVSVFDRRLHDGRWHIGTSGVRHVAAFQRAGPPLVLGLPGADHSATADTPRSPRPLETEIEYVTQASSNDFASVLNADQGSPTLTVQ